MRSRIKLPVAMLLGALATGMATGLAAQPASAPYPSGTVRVIVPYGAGGGIDGFTRLITQRLTEAWGQPVVVENRPGAGTTIGTQAVAKAAPDGLTLLMTTNTVAISGSVYEKLAYNAATDLAPITLTTRVPLVLVVGRSVPADSVKALIDHSNTRPGGVNLASSGKGGVTHLAIELLIRRGALKATHLPYKTTAASIPDVIGGRIDGFFAAPAAVLPQIEKGTLKPLVVTSATRFRLMPNVPTMIESGVPNYDVSLWFGLFAPAGTPAPIIDKVYRDVDTVLRRPDMIKAAESQGMQAVTTRPDEFRRLYQAEVTTWDNLIKEAGLKFD